MRVESVERWNIEDALCNCMYHKLLEINFSIGQLWVLLAIIGIWEIVSS